MLCRLKVPAAPAAVAVAVAVAVPAASAAAPANSRIDPTVCQLLNTAKGRIGRAQPVGGASLVKTLTNAGNTVGCPASSPRASRRSVGPQAR